MITHFDGRIPVETIGSLTNMMLGSDTFILTIGPVKQKVISKLIPHIDTVAVLGMNGYMHAIPAKQLLPFVAVVG